MKYLVPFDFTPITKMALEHAFALSKGEESEIQALHIVKSESDLDTAKAKFTDFELSLSESHQKRLSTKVKVGDIFHDISTEAQDGGFQLLIMGTHGAKGLQKLLGSHAIKVITSSNTPFIITQKKGPSSAGIKKIVLPVDLSYEKIQMVGFASKIAQKFNAEIHIVAKGQSDDFLKKRLANNLSKVSRQLKKDAVKHEINTLENKQSFYKEIIEYGAKIEADLFAIAHYPETIIPQFEKFSQELITNEWQIPVLIVNVEERIGVKSNYSFIGI